MMRTLKIYTQQLSNVQYSIINSSHHEVYYIPMTYLFYNRVFVLFDSLHPFCPPSQSCLWQPPVYSCIQELFPLDSMCK